MLLKKLSVINWMDDLLELPLEDTSSGYIVKSVDGLGPVKATLASSNYANQDGAQFYSGRREVRNLIIRLGLTTDTNTSIFELRSQLYRFLMPNTEALFKFSIQDHQEGTDLDVQITGRVESLEPSIFAKEPTVDISVLCFDPDFTEENNVAFQSTTDFGWTDIMYRGTVETGFRLVILPDRNIPYFSATLQHPNGDEMSLSFTRPIVSGNVVEVDSRRGSKGATLITGGGHIESALYGISPSSSWLYLRPGMNQVRLDTDAESWAYGMPYNLLYSRRYGGL